VIQHQAGGKKQGHGGSGTHIPNAIIEDVGGGGGVGGNTPAGAWNACLGVFGYPPMA
jgi:hypothetical protein